LSRNVKRLNRLEDITLDTAIIVKTDAEWRVLLTEYGGSE